MASEKAPSQRSRSAKLREGGLLKKGAQREMPCCGGTGPR